jgi:uncharacterized UBP type Zn finger protein
VAAALKGVRSAAFFAVRRCNRLHGKFLHHLAFCGILAEVNMMEGCTHTNQIRDVAPHSAGCEECLKSGDRWVHLRLCMTCGHVGCCDSSKNKHATKHFHSTEHPIIKSIEPGEDWGWCYLDEVELDFA